MVLFLKTKLIMLGLLIALPTFALIPHFFFLFPLFYILAYRRNQLSFNQISIKKVDPNVLIILLIILFSFIYRFFYGNTIKDFFPETVLMLLTLTYSKFIKIKDLKILIFIITLEALVVLLEYFLGVQSIIPSVQAKIASGATSYESNLLYYSRPYGLSENSSIIAYKLFIGFALTIYLRLTSYFWRVVQALILLASFFTFNRTVLLIIVIFICLLFIKPTIVFYGNLLRMKIKKNHITPLIFITLALILIISFGVYYFETIFSQLTRSKGFDLAGREGIWERFIVFIKNNFWFGNGTLKYTVSHHDGFAHAHNSFLQILASHGFFIFILYMFLVIRNIRANNIIFILSFLSYSLFQYGIFWGISLMDIIFFMFLFRPNFRPKKTDPV